MTLATITFADEATKTKSGEKNGKPWSITEQEAIIETPVMKNRCKITLASGQQPYPRGKYTFDPAYCLKVSDFGSIQLGRDLSLSPVAVPATAKAG